MKQLGRELKPDEKVLLAALSQHPGFPILYKMAEECCALSSAAAIKVDPADSNYVEKLKSAQLTARAMHDFSSSLFASCKWHAGEGAAERKVQDLMEQLHSK